MPGHPNRIEARKRPRVTLTPTIVTKNESAVLAISVAGGDIQDQTTLNCLLNYIEFGIMPNEAVTAARFSTGHHENSFRPDPERSCTIVDISSITVDPAISEAITDDLKKRGHKVVKADYPFGKPVMLYIDQVSRIAYAAGDPKTGRHASAVF